METIREFVAIVRQEYNDSRERTRQRLRDRHLANNLPTTTDVNTGAPLLNDYDATPSEDVNNPIKDDGEPRIRMPIFWGDATVPEDVDNPLKKDENSRIRIPIARRHRIIAWICFIIYGIFINLTIFYSVSYLGDQSTILKEKLTNTISKTYGVVAETYEEMKNPGSTEEVAALMTEFYELLAEMGYYEPEKIDRAPHANPSINKNYAAELGFSPKAIEMLEKLPYLNNDHDFWWSHGDGDAEFLLFGTFIDFRVDENLQGNEDPLYALWGQGDDGPKGFDEDGGKYMRPDYLCLSMLGNHGTTMILNVKNFKLWTIDQEMGSADPALKDVQAKGDDRNYNSLDNYPSRAANLVLNDYMQKFRDLEWMPGGLYNGNWDGDNYAKLYRENGWPSKFNRTAFMIAREQWEEDERMRWDAEQPFQEVAKYENWLSSSLWRIENNQKAISDVDAGKEIPNNQPDRPDRFADREKYRQELLDEVNSTTASLPKLLQDLEAARETLKGIDPAVRKAREDRIAKYGH